MGKQLILLIGPTIMIILGLVLIKNIAITFLLFYGWLLVVPILVSYRRKTRTRLIFPQPKYSMTVGILSGIICLIAIYSFAYLLQSIVIDQEGLEVALVQWDFTGAKVIFLVLFLIFINPLLEEFYWRRFMYDRLLHRLGSKLTIIITAFFYALYHFVVVMPIFHIPVFATLMVFLAGIMWGIFRSKFHTIVPSIVSHSIADLGIMLVYLFIII